MPVNLNGRQAGTVKGNQVNDPSVRVIRGKNQFPQSFIHPSTCRYGEVDPVAAIRCERGDVFPYKFVTDLNTFTMASPLKSEVNMYSACFKVPMQAIYPRNWDIMYPNPTIGEDIPIGLDQSGEEYDRCRALLDPILLGSNLCSSIQSALAQGQFNIDDFSDSLRVIFILESIFSAGSLFSKFNMHLDGNLFSVLESGNDSELDQVVFDDYFDGFFVPAFRNFLVANEEEPQIVSLDGNTRYHVQIDGSGSIPGYKSISFRRCLELFRTGEFKLSSNLSIPNGYVFRYPFSVLDSSRLINIEPIIAYQLACAHFFSNSKVDWIYSAELWRDNMQSLLLDISGEALSFNRNGVMHLYDVVSSSYLSDVVDYSISFSLSVHAYLFNLFGFQRSLRYGDYFTGSHVKPLAVGDVDAPVTDGSVNALDMTRKLQITRFLNKVNIVGSRIEDYLRALFGGQLPQAPKDVPLKLSEEKFSVSGFEVNNTGSDQLNAETENITTTNLRLSDSRFMFEVEIDEPCWIIAVQYFDAHRIYTKTMDRMAFHYDRFDDFIPDLQFIGDQDIKAHELDFLGSEQEALPWAYQLRYMEYKQRYSYASGGFIRRLKSWAFITDNEDGNPPSQYIDPDYIRSSPSEFDRFYKSLTGYSLGTYFHFITFNTNVMAPYRQMVYAPEILQ